MAIHHDTAKKKTGFNALDAFIILVVLLCLVGAGLRMFMGENGENVTPNEKYVVSFLIREAIDTDADALTSGDVFYLDTTNAIFGTLDGEPIVSPKQVNVIDENGQLNIDYSVGDSVFIRGRIIVEGYMSEEGFMLNGNTYLAPYKTIDVHTQYLMKTIEITEITKYE
ncbi:MAG: hypothetical protein J6D21_08665 [Clostridia bacterium]|nr:hypothetical protein [Clostridia bacterium]